MSTELRALIFDVDGTLADTEEFHRRAFNAVFAAAGLVWWWNRGTYRELLRVAGGRQRMRAYAEREDPSLAKRRCPRRIYLIPRSNQSKQDYSPSKIAPGCLRHWAEQSWSEQQLQVSTEPTVALTCSRLRSRWRKGPTLCRR